MKNAQKFAEEGKWMEAIALYDKVSESTKDGYKKAVAEKKKCIKALNENINSELDRLFGEGKYDEGLSLIESTEQYIEDKETLKNYKDNFEIKKEEQEKNKYNTGITYDQLARNPDEYEGKYVKFKGKVLQVQSSSGMTVYRIGTSGYGYYDNVIYAIQADTNTKNRVLEDDIITVRGMSSGLYTYKTVMGNSLTIPSMVIEYIDK